MMRKSAHRVRVTRESIATAAVLILLALPSAARGQAPVISSLQPAQGDTGAAVVILGSDFSPLPTDNVVRFGSVRAPVLSGTTSLLNVRVPTGALYAPVSLTHLGLTGFSPAPFIPTFPAGAGLAPGSFPFSSDYRAGTSGPYRAALGDVDDDGLSDLLVVNFNGNTVTLLRNASDGDTLKTNSFSVDADLPTGLKPSGLALADIDGDGKLDIVIGDFFDDFVSVYRNTSAGPTLPSFAPRVDITAGSGFKTLAMGDFDTDGKPDVAVARREANAVTLLRNTGTPGFVGFSVIPLSAVENGPTGIAAGDLDGDGRPDLVVANGTGEFLSLYRNISAGSVSFAPRQVIALPGKPASVALADLTGDGNLDVIVARGTSTSLGILRNTSTAGAISFASRVDVNHGLASASSVAASDLNGDGLVDLVTVSDVSSAVGLLENTTASGDVGFGPPVTYPTASVSVGIAAGDLTQNGKPEVAVANVLDPTNAVTVLLNRVTALPRLDVSTDTLVFPNVALGDSVQRELVITNQAPVPLTITGLTLTGTAFRKDSMLLPAVIGPNGSDTLAIRFVPIEFGDFSDTLVIASDGGDTTVALLGRSPFPGIAINPPALDFGEVAEFAVARRVIAVTDSTINTLIIDSIFTRNPAFIPDSSQATIAFRDTLYLGVRFIPPSSGPFLDTLFLRSNSNDSLVAVELTGVGVEATLTVLETGWNLVSVPRVPSSYAATDLFPSKVGTAFGYNTATVDYEARDTLDNGEGFWVLYAAPDSNFITGTRLDSTAAIAAQGGWVLIGSLTAPLAVSALQTEPPSQVVPGQAFAWDPVLGTFTPASTLVPGRGTWLLVSGACTIRIRQ